jgi:hypothetical protein
MSFRAANVVFKPASIGTGIKVSLRRHRGGAKLEVIVSEKVGQIDLNWSANDRIEVLVGENEHHGLLRLRKNNSVGQALVARRNTLKGSYLVVSLGPQDAFVDRPEAARWCQWEKIEDGWVEIALPTWADETAPRKPRTATPEKPELLKPPRRGVDVTASLMGDPAPGRREALAKMQDGAK